MDSDSPSRRILEGVAVGVGVDWDVHSCLCCCLLGQITKRGNIGQMISLIGKYPSESCSRHSNVSTYSSNRALRRISGS